jgi:hypothetical protein
VETPTPRYAESATPASAPSSQQPLDVSFNIDTPFSVQIDAIDSTQGAPTTLKGQHTIYSRRLLRRIFGKVYNTPHRLPQPAVAATGLPATASNKGRGQLPKERKESSETSDSRKKWVAAHEGMLCSLSSLDIELWPTWVTRVHMGACMHIKVKPAGHLEATWINSSSELDSPVSRP